jgi:hypothetical protein
LFQALTSVQEQTMSLIPKMLAVLGVALLLLAPMLQVLRDYTERVLAAAQHLRPVLRTRVLAPGTIEGFGLVLVRTSALVLAAPLFGLALPFSGARMGLIVILSAFFYSVACAPLPEARRAAGVRGLARRASSSSGSHWPSFCTASCSRCAWPAR